LLVPHALGPWLLVPGGTLLTSLLAYRGAAAVANGESLDVAFDLHRFELCTRSICRLKADQKPHNAGYARGVMTVAHGQRRTPIRSAVRRGAGSASTHTSSGAQRGERESTPTRT
jgi:hypothetical protein